MEALGFRFSGLCYLSQALTRYTGEMMECSTVLPLSIQTLCELYRHVASPNDIIFSIRRLHSKHLYGVHAVVPNLITIVFCIPP